MKVSKKFIRFKARDLDFKGFFVEMGWKMSVNVKKKMYKVLAYYHYVKIADPHAFRDEHHKLCLEKNLLGRIYVAGEGINGTVSGLAKDCDEYIFALKQNFLFKGMDIKIHKSEKHTFHRLHVRVKREIVNSGLYDIDPNSVDHKTIAPQDLWKNIDDNTVLLDMRSNYEHRLGKFKGAVTLDIDNFREFPEKINQIKKTLQGKKVVIYCTGSVKCEKTYVYLKNIGVEDVASLRGGIIRYGLETDGKDFEGKCYVFDNRVTVDINKNNPSVISECFSCGSKTAKMVNCANAKCNIHITICDRCLKVNEGACSEKCKKSEQKREYNPKGYFAKKANGYNPLKGFKALQKAK